MVLWFGNALWPQKLKQQNNNLPVVTLISKQGYINKDRCINFLIKG